MSKNMNTVTHNSETYTRKGKRMPFAVITTPARGAALVEWASTRELAERNANGHRARAAKVAAGQTLGGVFSTDWYVGLLSVDVLPTETAEV